MNKRGQFNLCHLGARNQIVTHLKPKELAPSVFSLFLEQRYITTSRTEGAVIEFGCGGAVGELYFKCAVSSLLLKVGHQSPLHVPEASALCFDSWIRNTCVSTSVSDTRFETTDSHCSLAYLLVGEDCT